MLAESVKSVIPKRSVRREPHVKVAEAAWLDLIDPSLRIGPDADQPGSTQHLEMLRRGRLTDRQGVHEFIDRLRAAAQQIEQSPPVGVRERNPRRFHCSNMPVKEYACQGICETREWQGDSGNVGSAESH